MSISLIDYLKWFKDIKDFKLLQSKLFQTQGSHQEIEKSFLCKDVLGILKLFVEYLVLNR